MQPNFQHRIEQYQIQISSLNKQLENVSLLRLIIFTGSLTLTLILANAGLITLVGITVMVGAPAFGIILSRYNSLVKARNHVTFLRQINDSEVLIQQRKLKDRDTGKEFLTSDHAYAADLDIFGQHSLFQLLNRTNTEAGKIQLAGWLMQPADRNQILERQEAVSELSPKIKWRQEFQAAGMPFVNPKSNYAQLIQWIEAPADLLPQRRKYLWIAITLGLAATLALALGIYHLGLVLFAGEDFSVAYILPMVISLIVNRQVIKKQLAITERILNDLQYNVTTLASSESLITLIELASFDSALLQKWQAIFRDSEYSAVKEIQRLRKTLEAFQQRGSRRMIGKNDFYSIFNSIWLLDIYFILSTEKWKARNGPKLQEWSIAIGNFEAINSLSGFTYANPDFIFPNILDTNYRIHFDGIGHPLLKEHQRICNDFSLVEKGSVAIVTGSNMAGKSTFLRTVGCNLVLAMTGAPCCALSGEISPMSIFTSMRTLDNLEEGISSFYAELKRVEQLLHLIANGQSVLFLLDEMFKGTNSEDRYKGGVSLIRQLSRLNAFGMISTHDLQLAKAASQHLPVRNYSFNSELKDEKIIFNYKLKDGFCTDFNASTLMKLSGIDIKPDL